MLKSKLLLTFALLLSTTLDNMKLEFTYIYKSLTHIRGVVAPFVGFFMLKN